MSSTEGYRGINRSRTGARVSGESSDDEGGDDSLRNRGRDALKDHYDESCHQSIRHLFCGNHGFTRYRNWERVQSILQRMEDKLNLSDATEISSDTVLSDQGMEGDGMLGTRGEGPGSLSLEKDSRPIFCTGV